MLRGAANKSSRQSPAATRAATEGDLSTYSVSLFGRRPLSTFQVSNMSHNGLPVLLALLLLLLKYSRAETSAVSSASPTSTVRTTSTTGKTASTRSATEERSDLWMCKIERQCHNVTCAECMPQDESCAFRCQQKCTCACLGYEIDGTDLGLYLECGTKRDCFAKYFPAVLVCPDEECLAKRLLDMETCKCECLQLTRAQASVAVAITAATICGETMRENNGQCKIETFSDD
ncbi:hypothetical protein FOCC_FOCC011494 [Frankliniella occidentalis]|nr:hypothetical protein FOCC_FOCC011494 [Frankliniella occidentalis]